MGKTSSNRLVKAFLWFFIIWIIGMTYEQIGEYFDGIKYKPAGRLIKVNGHRMHIFGEGSGRETVVFTAGWQTPSPYVDLYPLYHKIATRARVVVYDRPGYGWSDLANTPRDIDTITKEIHELLEKSKEKPPYILVGHSIGSFEVIRYAQIYKDEVKGVILIDGSNPAMYSNMAKPSFSLSMRVSIFRRSIYLLNKSGISRLYFSMIPNAYASTVLVTARNGMSLAPDRFKRLDRAMFLKTFNNRNQIDEGAKKEMNADRIVSGGYLRDIPLRIITSEAINHYKEARENQKQLRKWSNDSKQIVVKGAGHAIHWAHPEAINREIQDILKK